MNPTKTTRERNTRKANTITEAFKISEVLFNQVKEHAQNKNLTRGEIYRAAIREYFARIDK